MKHHARRHAFEIAIIYAVVSTLWIVLSDALIGLTVQDASLSSDLQTYKGTAFVVVTACLIYLLLFRRMTQQEAVEERLREGEARYRNLFEANPFPMWVYDVETLRFLAVNDSAVNHYGYSREEFLARTIMDIRPPEEWERLRQNLASVGAGLDRAGLWRHLKKDGTLIEVEITSHTIQFGPRRAEVVLANDITERQRAATRLLQTQQSLELALAAAGIAAWEIDLTSPERGMVWSVSSVRLCGLDREQFPANECQFFDWVHPEDRELSRERFARAIRENTRYECEFRVAGPHGEVRWQLALGRTVNDDAGRPTRMLGVCRDITAARHSEEQLRTQLRQLESLHEIDVSIADSLDVNLTLNILTQALLEHLNVDAASVLLYTTVGNTLDFAVGQGLITEGLRSSHVKMGEGYAGRVALERRRLFVPNLAEATEGGARPRLLAREGFAAYIGVPLVAKGQLKGVLEVLRCAPLEPDAGWFGFLETVAGQASVALDNAQLFERLQRLNTELSLAYEATIEGWSRAMDLRDKETEGHTLRVTELSIRMAQAMGMSDEQIVHLRRGALLHDMGKLGVPDQILLKPGKLSDEEWAVMRQHPQFALEMLSGIEYLRPALDVPYCHHEKWDGTGYPRGLKGAQIPLAARIFAVVDVWDALRSNRPYRAAWPEASVVAHIRSRSGEDFDPEAVDTFMRLIGSAGFPCGPAASDSPCPPHDQTG